MLPRLNAIQALRAIAANLVVAEHLWSIDGKYTGGRILPDTLATIGQFGVDIFFVISGVIMATLAKDADWRSFLWARVTRIYPIYWFYSAIVLILYFSVPTIVNSSFSAAPSIWKSFALWPDAQLPLLMVGWTLIHEMYFYLVVAVMIALRVNLVAGVAVWSVVLQFPVDRNYPVLAVVFSPFTYLFIGGMLLGGALRKPSFSTLVERIPVPRFLIIFGDASYSTYLSHILVLSALGRLYALLSAPTSFVLHVLFLLTCVVAANIVGLVSFRYLEVPTTALTRGVRQRFRVA
jgi:peptidoglycan/LPS O-acetylase OafA/YrhL